MIESGYAPGEDPTMTTTTRRAPARLADRWGNTVEPVEVDGLAQFIVRDRYGYLPYSMGLGPLHPPITTAQQLVDLGVDIQSLHTVR